MRANQPRRRITRLVSLHEHLVAAAFGLRPRRDRLVALGLHPSTGAQRGLALGDRLLELFKRALTGGGPSGALEILAATLGVVAVSIPSR